MHRVHVLLCDVCGGVCGVPHSLRVRFPLRAHLLRHVRLCVHPRVGLSVAVHLLRYHHLALLRFLQQL